LNFDAARRIATEALSRASKNPELSPILETIREADPERTVNLTVFSLLASLPGSRAIPSISEEKIHTAVDSALREAGTKSCAREPVNLRDYLKALSESLKSGELRPHFETRRL
jgi:hypothetical protein